MASIVLRSSALFVIFITLTQIVRSDDDLPFAPPKSGLSAPTPTIPASKAAGATIFSKPANLIAHNLLTTGHATPRGSTETGFEMPTGELIAGATRKLAVREAEQRRLQAEFDRKQAQLDEKHARKDMRKANRQQAYVPIQLTFEA